MHSRPRGRRPNARTRDVSGAGARSSSRARKRTNDTSKLRIEDEEAFILDLGGDATFTVRELQHDERRPASLVTRCHVVQRRVAACAGWGQSRATNGATTHAAGVVQFLDRGPKGRRLCVSESLRGEQRTMRTSQWPSEVSAATGRTRSRTVLPRINPTPIANSWLSSSRVSRNLASSASVTVGNSSSLMQIRSL
jgi:hypothetical protein